MTFGKNFEVKILILATVMSILVWTFYSLKRGGTKDLNEERIKKFEELDFNIDYDYLKKLELLE